MSQAKKLNIPIARLNKIAEAINENTAANRIRSKENKILTDKFIKQFEINRKDFSETIKDTNIKYNKSTFFYDIETSNGLNLEEVNKSCKKVDNENLLEEHTEYKQTTKTDLNEIQSIPKYTFQIPAEFKEILALSGDLKEMVGWYKNQTNTNIIKIPEINIKIPILDGDVVTRSFKMYKKISEEFAKFAVSRKETQKDLISLAILEFIQKYK